MTRARPVENDVKSAVKKLLDEFQWHHWPGSAGPYSLGGVSDRLAVRGRPGKGCIFLAIEVKLDKRDGSKRQEQFLQDCRDQGAIAIVVNQARVPKLRQLLEAIDAELFPVDPPASTRCLGPGDFGWGQAGVAPTATRYWHHPESGALWTTQGTDEKSDSGDGALVEELTAEQYAWWREH